MFAKSIIGSARFLRMPSTTRLLYYDLGMQADDDGVVEAFSVMRTTGATEDDLKVLASKGFVSVLNEDLVAYITDWGRNNYIPKDRYHASLYRNMLIKMRGEPAMELFKNLGETEVEPPCIQDVHSLDTQVRLGKDRIGKVRIRESTEGPPAASSPTPTVERPSKPPRKKHGQYGWVQLTDEEYSRLLNDLGETEVKRCITYIDESAQATGNKNKWRDWNLVVRRCHRDGWGLGKTAGKPPARETIKTAADYDSGESFI